MVSMCFDFVILSQPKKAECADLFVLDGRR